MKYLLFLFAASLSLSAFSQSGTDTTYNFGFENVKTGNDLPDKWVKFNRGTGFKSESTKEFKHSGERSLLIEETSAEGDKSFASIVQTIPAKFIGKEIEFKAWLKFENVTKFVGIMVRIDNASNKSVQFQSLQSKQIHGTKDWELYSVKATIPNDAQNIYIANILSGPGKLWMDDAQVLIDGVDISQAKINTAYNPHPPHKPAFGDSTSVSGRVKLKDANLYYETYGSGEPLLLLHGDSQSILAFNYQINELAKKFKIIAVDTRGQGKSTDETTSPLSYDLFADDMKQLLDAIHIKKTNILGWSDGGNTGLIMAIKYPGYVNKLAITGANLVPTNEAVPDTVLNQIRDGVKEWQSKNTPHSKMEVRLFTMMLNEPHISIEQLKTIHAPVLVMAGEHDIIIEKHTRVIAAAIPHSKLVIFKGATHYVPVDIPEKFNATVISFLED